MIAIKVQIKKPLLKKEVTEKRLYGLLKAYNFNILSCLKFLELKPVQRKSFKSLVKYKGYDIPTQQLILASKRLKEHNT